MRNRITLFTATAALGATALLAACSGGTPGASAVPGVADAAKRAAGSDLHRTGIAPQFFNLARTLRAAHHGLRVTGPRDLFVDDQNAGVEILANRTWKNTGSISNGIDGPDGNFIDKRGNLYVANYGADDIAQYAPGASMPDFTYNTGMIDPTNVTVDARGNVYESDYDNEEGSGFVNEYKQGVNEVFASCSPGGDVEGVAVDGHGNVFVALNFASGGGVVEYGGGLRGCNKTTLITSLKFAGGIVLDRSGNLLVSDQFASSVDVLAPPYNSITRTFGYGFGSPFHLTINKKNDLIYVTDSTAGTVDVLSYPRGEVIADLNAAQGLAYPLGAVDGQNYVP